MSGSDNYIKILEKMGDIQATVAKVEVECQTIKEDVKEIKIEDNKQNQLLAEHIAGVKTAQARLDNEILARTEALKQYEKMTVEQYTILSNRLEIVEFLPNFIKSASKIILWLGGISGAIYGIAKFFDLF